MPSSMPFLKTLWRSMSVAMPLLLTVVASTTLVYSTGGPYEANAGARSGISAFYVDAVAGDDNNDGTQPLSDGNGAGPWQTASKALHWSYPPGTHLLFKRGTVYLGGGALDTVGTKLASTEANPFVLGAYGDELLALPKLEYNVQVRGTHVMVRDLEMHRVILNGAFILLFRCEIHSMIQPPTTLSFANNLIVMNHKSSYCSVVECLVYDCDANDLISIHDSSSGGTVGSHHWVVDNTIIGNDGVEQCFDFASKGGAIDVKYVNNRCQCAAVPGLSQKTGTAGSGLTAAKVGEFVWIVNNVVTGGCTSYGAQFGGHNQQDSGNIVYDISNPTKHNAMIKIVTKKGVQLVTHNTFLQSATGRTPIEMVDPSNGDRNGVRVTFTHNVLGLKVNEGSIIKLNLPPAVGTGDGNGTIEAFDHNVYMNLNGGTAGIGTVNSQTLAEWQAASGGLDAHSGDGDVAGVSIPDATTWVDPRTWGNARGSPLNVAFAKHFTPTHFQADGVTPNPYCAKTATPGAFDCDGNRIGIFEPFAEFDCVGTGQVIQGWDIGTTRCDTENGGFGWSGPPLIRQRYPLRGSNGVLVSGVLNVDCSVILIASGTGTGTCSACSNPTTCTAITCDANTFNSNNDITDGCEATCAEVTDGTCTACTTASASGCTSVACSANTVDTNGDASDGCEADASSGSNTKTGSTTTGTDTTDTTDTTDSTKETDSSSDKTSDKKVRNSANGDSSGTENQTGLIVGIIAGVLLVVGGGAVLAYVVTKRKQHSKGETLSDDVEMTNPAADAELSNSSSGNDKEWEEYVDSNSGSKYYVNRQTGETTWDKPLRKKDSVKLDDAAAGLEMNENPMMC